MKHGVSGVAQPAVCCNLHSSPRSPDTPTSNHPDGHGESARKFYDIPSLYFPRNNATCNLNCVNILQNSFFCGVNNGWDLTMIMLSLPIMACQQSACGGLGPGLMPGVC